MHWITRAMFRQLLPLWPGLTTATVKEKCRGLGLVFEDLMCNAGSKCV